LSYGNSAAARDALPYYNAVLIFFCISGLTLSKCPTLEKSSPSYKSDCTTSDESPSKMKLQSKCVHDSAYTSGYFPINQIGCYYSQGIIYASLRDNSENL
ncbi:hypothetical protein ACH5RR_009463, partial [Cinchona calisaya]